MKLRNHPNRLPVIRRNSQGEGYDIVKTTGEVIASGFETHDEAANWLIANHHG